MQQPPVGTPPNLQRGTQRDHDLPVGASVPLALSLSPNQFIGTASDRQWEARSYTGWNYVAIAAVCRAAASAEVQLFDDRVTPGQKKSAIDYPRRNQRKSLMTQFGSRWKSFAKRPDQAVQAAPGFRWWRLAEQPNPWATGSQLRSTIVQQLRLHGVAMVWNVKNAFGKTVWRLPVPMALVTPIAPGTFDSMPMGGVKVHSFGWMIGRFGRVIANDRGAMYVANREISVDDLTIYAYPHPYLPGDGTSPTSAMFAWIELAQKGEKTQAEQYDRGPEKKVIVSPPQESAGDDAALKAYQKRIDRQVKETETGVIVAAHGGIHDLTVAPDEMGYPESSQAGRESILAGHGVPGAAVGMAAGMTYGSVAAVLQAFNTLSAQPDLDMIAAEDALQMRSEEGDAFDLKYICPAYDDPELTEQRLSSDMEAGSITVGEWRIQRGLEPFGDERDDMIAGSEAIKSWVPKHLRQPAVAGKAPESAESPDIPAVTGGEPMTRLRTILASQKQQKSLIRNQPGEARPYVVAVDLDGTIAIETGGAFDEWSIPEPDTAMVEVVRALKDAGCGIVIYTCRDSDTLVAQWLDDHNVPFDAINENPWGLKTDGKMMADIYLDNRAVNARGAAAAVMASLLDQVDQVEVRERLRKAVYARRFDRMYGFLFVPVDGAAERIAREGRALVRPEHLAGDGLEPEPHVTLLHAVAERDPFTITETLRAVGKFTYEVGKLTTFVRDGIAYVVVSVRGQEIDAVRRVCESSLSHIASEFSWNPHITIGVVDARYADQYEGRELSITGSLIQVKKLVYRPPASGDLVIPLK